MLPTGLTVNAPVGGRTTSADEQGLTQRAAASGTLRSLEMLRAVAAMVVVLYHVDSIVDARFGTKPLGGWFGAGYHGVDLFFVLSGFIILHVHHSDLGRPQRYLNYAYNRLTRLYPSVLIMTALAAVTYRLGFGGLAKAGKLDSWGVVASALLLPQPGVPLVNVTWTLKYELFFYALFGLAIVARRSGVALVLVWQACVLTLLWSGHVPHEWVAAFYARPLCLEFGIGMGSALLLRRIPAIRAGSFVPALVLLAGVAAFASGLLTETLTRRALGDALSVAVFGLGAAGVILGAILVEWQQRLWSSRLLVFLGRASYSIYLVHFSAISLAVAVMRRVGLGVTAPLGLALAAFGIGAGVLFYLGVDRPTHEMFRARKAAFLGTTAIRAAAHAIGRTAP